MENRRVRNNGNGGFCGVGLEFGVLDLRFSGGRPIGLTPFLVRPDSRLSRAGARGRRLRTLVQAVRSRQEPSRGVGIRRAARSRFRVFRSRSRIRRLRRFEGRGIRRSAAAILRIGFGVGGIRFPRSGRLFRLAVRTQPQGLPRIERLEIFNRFGFPLFEIRMRHR